MDPAGIRVARYAMGTRFEILLCDGGDEARLRAAGEEALDEIERLERQLSLFRPASDLARINAQAAQRPVRVEPGLFRLLQACHRLWEETGGAFDITVGPLMHCWGFRTPREAAPSPAELTAARDLVGMKQVILDTEARTIRFARHGVALDLGAVAKGWALDEAILILREAGIANALLHGGTSTSRALGRPAPDTAGWTVAIRPPPPEVLPDQKPWPEEFVRTVLLTDEALSVSAVAGRVLRRGGQIDGHVLDPREGAPVREGLLAAVILPSATDSDALSTALLAGGQELHQHLTQKQPHLRSLLLTRGGISDFRL
jgi:FAD:protein FMN transferase